MSLAQGFESILGPTVLEIDKAIHSVKESQNELGKEIERLIAELELFSEIAESPKLQPCLEKLVDAKKRLITTNTLMTKTNERVERIQKELLNIKK
ncbi:Snapin/Pallidin/Snn1 [Cokeromyces recurvatus]|uniref:Snapin/Pallidin/Snn1 n=1 Tax=Cokeromyces recurvatus TaxID=90255 RepID=UPI002220D568|nr:Snapin/Pallidin/Snn1 [Cokeromyces recurvatus]KAI7902602.1 Snapin/Pallidin/Snn1 [Cokeromyces recurvatus]